MLTEESWLQAAGHIRNPVGLAIRFEYIAVKDEAASDKQGKPVFNDVEYIEKRVPGDKLNIVHKPVDDDDRKQFAQQYKAWKAGLEDPESGVPLKEWPPMTRSEVETFAYHGVRTVEDLAGMSDATCKGIGAGVMKRRDQAADYLKRANLAAPSTHLRAELAKRDNQIEALQRQLSELTRLSGKSRAAAAEDDGGIPYVGVEPVAPVEAPTPKKRGRPAKQTTSATE